MKTQKLLTFFPTDIVEYFKRSSSALAKLTNHLKQNDLPVIKLKQDCITRWNSTLDMIRRILKLKEPIATITALIRVETKDEATRSFLDMCSFTTDEIQILNQIVIICTPFETITEQISGEKYVTSSTILVFIKILYKKINTFLTDINLFETRALLTQLKADFDKRFPLYEANELLCQSTFLDPRFKKAGFRDENKFTRTSIEIQRRIAASFKENPENENTPITRTTSDNEALATLWQEFDDEVQILTGSGTPGVGSIIETDKYQNEPLIHRHDNPLKYWLDRRHVYPGLFQLVGKRLCIPATSVPCERIFSKAGAIMTQRRNRLTSEKFQKLIFLKDNKKFMK